MNGDVVSLPSDLDGTAELVYTGHGSLPWIQDRRGGGPRCDGSSRLGAMSSCSRDIRSPICGSARQMAPSQSGLRVTGFRESPTLYWDQFPSWPAETRRRLPNSYAILAELR